MSLKFAELPDVGAAVIELPYERTSLVMRVYLPKSPRGWQMLRASDWLLPERSRELRSKFKQRAVELLIPKFQIASKVSLRNALTESGLGDLFTNRADFSKISRDPLMLSNIRQQTFIEIDEIGTRAGALTEAELITAGVAPDPVRFFVTHPFFYTIVDPVSGVVFFAGRVTCPPVLQPEPPRERMILE